MEIIATVSCYLNIIIVVGNKGAVSIQMPPVKKLQQLFCPYWTMLTYLQSTRMSEKTQGQGRIERGGDEVERKKGEGRTERKITLAMFC